MEIKFYTTKISFLFRFVNFLSSEATLLMGRMHFEITMDEITNIKTLKTFPMNSIISMVPRLEGHTQYMNRHVTSLFSIVSFLLTFWDLILIPRTFLKKFISLRFGGDTIKAALSLLFLDFSNIKAIENRLSVRVSAMQC